MRVYNARVIKQLNDIVITEFLIDEIETCASCSCGTVSCGKKKMIIPTLNINKIVLKEGDIVKITNSIFYLTLQVLFLFVFPLVFSYIFYSLFLIKLSFSEILFIFSFIILSFLGFLIISYNLIISAKNKLPKIIEKVQY